MIRVALFDNHNSRKFIEFDDVPMVDGGGYRCLPDDLVSRDSARRIAEELASGRMSGWIQGYWWYRQAASRPESGRSSTKPRLDATGGDAQITTKRAGTTAA
ncbi:MAG: hypothetical protein KJZ87_25290 [Thermoguttaceae bacterium]|nr:hypothetical protein [Thermoguttaceae bacterium]